MVALAFTASRPIGQVSSWPSTTQAPPWLGVADTKLNPVGRWSITLAVAESGPRLVAVSVNVLVAPTVRASLVVVLTIRRSARLTAMTVTSLLLIVTSCVIVAG